MTRLVDISGTQTPESETRLEEASVGPDVIVAGVPNIGAQFGVKPITYKTVENKRVHLEWTREADDYIYQWRPLQASPLDEREIVARLIAVLADYVPRDIDVNIDIPVPDMGVLSYTIRINKVAERPGAERMCEDKILEALCAIDVWSPSVSPR
jgi:hypothetical protein